MATKLEKQIARVYAAAGGDRSIVRKTAKRLRNERSGKPVGMKTLAKELQKERSASPKD